ncbi:MAG: MBL fold metallo-hydrolase [Alphaproteobacteria bacterium]|nr:MBL fold metallo-hydrolase [Alphaproteobacteria bacterium]
MRPLVRAFVVALAVAFARDAAASCQAIASRPVPTQLASVSPLALAQGEVGLTFVGHASFLIESPQGVTIVTDYNDYVRPRTVPTIATMNVAHTTHYSNNPDPRIKHVLRGWNPTGIGPARHELAERDVFVRNVPTNIRNWGDGGTRLNGNSIFIFEVADLCLVHLGHLHHELTREDLGVIGEVDVLMVPVDGGVTMTQFEMAEVVRNIHPRLVIPMHYFGPHRLERFIEALKPHFTVRYSTTPHLVLARQTMPDPPELLILPGN